MKAFVDPELCTGCGICVDICPDIFDINEEVIAEVLVDGLEQVQMEACQAAADDCPTGAIYIDLN